MSNKTAVERLQEILESLEKAEDKPFHGYNKEKHSRTGGLSSKAREKYNRETGSNLKAPVTEKNPTGKQAARKKSFCARMSGVKGPTSKEGKLTPKGAALKRWRCSKCEDIHKDEGWIQKPKSEDYTHRGHTFHEVEHPNTPDGHKAYHLTSPTGEKDVLFARNVGEVGKYLNQRLKRSAIDELKELEKRCWEGYEPVPGKKPYSKGSCAKKSIPKPKASDYGLTSKPLGPETGQGKQLAAIGAKVAALKELQAKNPNVNWKEVLSGAMARSGIKQAQRAHQKPEAEEKSLSAGHHMGGPTAVGGSAIVKSATDILADLLKMLEE